MEGGGFPLEDNLEDPDERCMHKLTGSIYGADIQPLIPQLEASSCGCQINCSELTDSGEQFELMVSYFALFQLWESTLGII